jgi:DNA-binding beta-propeller fold protein YncE
MPIPKRLASVTLAAAILLAACSQPPRRLEPAGLFWPMPPDPPRIAYVQSIYTEDDLGREYTFREKLFGKDYHDGMARPYGVSARRDKVIVSDIALRRVLIFDLIAKRMSDVGTEDGLQIPAAAVTDGAGNLFVADSGGARVVVYDRQGGYRTTYSLGAGRPVGLAVSDELRRLYVVDRAGHRVVVFSLEGQELFTFGERGTAAGKFNIPIGIAIDHAGRVHVLDGGNFRVQTFTADGSFLSAFGEVGDRPGMFSNPKGIAVDSDGHIYVTDAAFCNFQIFDRQGNVLLFVGEMGPWPGHLHLPGGIAIDENDRIYVADQLNSRIQVFQYLKTAESPTQP